MYLPAPELAFLDAVWATVEEYGDARCSAFMPVPRPLQTVQRAEFWGAILSASTLAGSFWVLTISKSSGQLVGCLTMAASLNPYLWLRIGDLIVIVEHMIHSRGLDAVRVAKVKGHATEADVELNREGF